MLQLKIEPSFKAVAVRRSQIFNAVNFSFLALPFEPISLVDAREKVFNYASISTDKKSVAYRAMSEKFYRPIKRVMGNF